MTLFLTRLFLSLQTRLAREERGATTVEYALVVVAIAAAVAGLMAIITGKLTTMFNGLTIG